MESNSLNTFKEDHPKNIPAKFGSNWRKWPPIVRATLLDELKFCKHVFENSIFIKLLQNMTSGVSEEEYYEFLHVRIVQIAPHHHSHIS